MVQWQETKHDTGRYMCGLRPTSSASVWLTQPPLARSWVNEFSISWGVQLVASELTHDPLQGWGPNALPFHLPIPPIGKDQRSKIEHCFMLGCASTHKIQNVLLRDWASAFKLKIVWYGTSNTHK